MKSNASLSKASKKEKSHQDPKMPHDTEANDHTEVHLYRGVRPKSEVEGLPFKTLPTHLQADKDDETTLAAGYSRLGAGDIDASEDRDGNDITVSELSQNDGSAT